MWPAQSFYVIVCPSSKFLIQQKGNDVVVWHVLISVLSVLSVQVHQEYEHRTENILSIHQQDWESLAYCILPFIRYVLQENAYSHTKATINSNNLQVIKFSLHHNKKLWKFASLKTETETYNLWIFFPS